MEMIYFSKKTNVKIIENNYMTIYIGSIPDRVFGDSKNTEYLSEDDKNNLGNLMLQFEGLL